jgi:7-cyano-7-deazaguanine synthase in queuosine biosynthesis
MSLICWSGGHDSTLALLQLARKASSDNPVKALAIVHPQILAAEENRAARKAILAWMKAQGYFVIYQEVQIKHKKGYEWNDSRIPHAKRVITCENNHGAMQPQIWISTASLYLDKDEDLHMGYIRGDDVWHYREWVCDLFYNLKTLMYKTGSLQFPLEWTEKYEVIDQLKACGLLDLCWTCETPIKGQPCGGCSPCEKLWQAKQVSKKVAADKKMAIARHKNPIKVVGRRPRK